MAVTVLTSTGSTGDAVDTRGDHELNASAEAPGHSAGPCFRCCSPPRHASQQRPLPFLDERSTDFYPDWATCAREAVSALRLMAGQDPTDRALMALVGELATRSTEFRTWRGGHTVRTHTTGTKRINHPVVGEITLAYASLGIPSSSGIVIATYLAEPGSPSADALDLLRSWAAQPLDAAVDPPAQAEKSGRTRGLIGG